MTRALMIAAVRSGSGKTLITSALALALQRRGLRVAAAKSGPDHIDPRFHEKVTGRPSFNLDPWSMDQARLLGLAAEASEGADILLVEGVMGLFDGSQEAGEVGFGATADLAKALDLPVVLLQSASGTAQSLAAEAFGFSAFDPGLKLAGLIINRAASERHEALIARGMAGRGLPPILGFIPPAPDANLPRRHLGLVQAEELEALESLLSGFADLLETCLDLDALLDLARPLPGSSAPGSGHILAPLGQRIAIARDRAFSFAYPHIEHSWQKAGAALLPFSPLADEAPDAGADAIFLPGGYPELHLPLLSENKSWSSATRRAAENGTWIYGECGGFMVMGESIEDEEGEVFPVLGLLDLKTSFAKRNRKLHLGYRRLSLLHDLPFGPAGSEFRAHEFHYAATLSASGEALFALGGKPSGTQELQAGLVKGRCFGSFCHVVCESQGASSK